MKRVLVVVACCLVAVVQVKGWMFFEENGKQGGKNDISRKRQQEEEEDIKRGEEVDNNLHFVPPASIPQITDECGELTGVWYNQHGSLLILSHSDEAGGGKLSGTYSTAVERESGSAGERFSPVTGHSHFPTRGPRLLAFSVLWSGGRSITSWTGQCHVCDGGEERLDTTWILSEAMQGCGHLWKANRIGHDIFTRRRPQPDVEEEELVEDGRTDMVCDTEIKGDCPVDYACQKADENGMGVCVWQLGTP